MKRKSFSLILTAAVLLAATVIVAAQGAPDRSKAQIEQMKRRLRAEDVPIHFVGQVLDQHGNPIDGATVTIHIKKYSPLPSELYAKIDVIKIQTDQNGKFEVNGQKGSHLHIEDISKEGYALEEGGIKQRGFDFGAGTPNHYTFNANRPVIFHLRKRGEGTFLLGGDGIGGFKAPKSYLAFSLTTGWAGPLDKYSKRKRIELIVTFESINGKSVLTFSPTGLRGGIVVSNKKLYSAPASGYHPTYKVSSRSSEEKDLHEYLYIRGGIPATYSRLDADIRISPDHAQVGYIVVTNPYGNRNLEKIEHLPGEVGLPAGDTANRYIDAGLLPPEPDFKAALKNPKKMYEDWLWKISPRKAAMDWARDHDPDFYKRLREQSDVEWRNRQLDLYHKQKREMELRRKEILEKEATAEQCR